MERWNKKVAVVTGAGGGLGSVISITLAKRGMVVVGLDVNEQKLKELATKANIDIIKCDITAESEVVGAFNKIESQYGGVDLLINNAGLANTSGLIDGSFNVWKSLLETNVLGMSLCSREAIKTMKFRSDHGHIININSMYGHSVPKVYDGPVGMYPTTKHAVTGFCKSLRLELRSAGLNIKVTSISPGFVYTDIAKYFAKLAGIPIDEKSDEIPSFCLDCQDVADAIVNVISHNPRVEVQELSLIRGDFPF